MVRMSKQAKAYIAKVKASAVKQSKTSNVKARKITMSQLPKAVRPEMKRLSVVKENETTLVLGNSLGALQQPCKLSEGSGVQQRIGRQCILRGIHIKGHFWNRTGNPAFFIRMLVLQDMKKNLVDFTGDELLVKGADVVNHAQGTESAYLSINKKRYKVYSDKLIKLSSQNTNAENLKIINTFIKFNLTLNFEGTGSGDLSNNNIQIVYWPINPTNSIVALQTIVANYATTAYYNDA